MAIGNGYVVDGMSLTEMLWRTEVLGLLVMLFEHVSLYLPSLRIIKAIPFAFEIFMQKLNRWFKVEFYW